MSYMHIDNLYKNQEILLFKECYAMEKIHGTSAHISLHYFDNKKESSKYDFEIENKYCKVGYSSGGENYTRFIQLFNSKELAEKFLKIGINTSVIIYGEAYGGKQQGMSDTYGKELKFIAFEVKVGDNWLSVPQAEELVKNLDIEFVDYTKVNTDLDSLDKEKNKDSTQAIRNGMRKAKKREGVVLRPLLELTKNNGQRIIVKHKRDDFRETKTKRIISPEKLKVLELAKEVAEEWVTEMRLSHVLDKFPEPDITKTGHIIKAMLEDVKRESDNEVIWSKEIQKEISKVCAIMFKNRIKGVLE